MLLILTVTMLPPIAIGLLITRTFLPQNRPAAAAWLLNLSLGVGLGIGVLSLLFFLIRLLIGPSNLVYGIAEILTLAAAAAGCWLFREKSWSGPEPRPFGGWQWLLLAATIVCLILAEAQFLDSSAASPYGNWDAWSIWNLRAELLAQPDGSWKNAFSPLLNQLAGGGATHGDYPLLLSGYIARCWSLTGAIGDVTVPIAVAGLFALATIGLLTGGLAVLRGWATGLTAGLILLGTAGFLRNCDWQFSDVPLGFFYLAVFILFFIFDASGGTGRLAVVAGLALGCAAWTKDEGMFFRFIRDPGAYYWTDRIAAKRVVEIARAAWCRRRVTSNREFLLQVFSCAEGDLGTSHDGVCCSQDLQCIALYADFDGSLDWNGSVGHGHRPPGDLPGGAGRLPGSTARKVASTDGAVCVWTVPGHHRSVFLQLCRDTPRPGVAFRHLGRPI